MQVVGQNIEHYRILDKLNDEEMGAVYKVLDTRQDVVRSIKVLKPTLADDQAFMRRFGREAAILAGLKHPNILAVDGFYDDPAHPFIVMEYVEASTLALLIRRKGPLDAGRVLPLFRQLLAGLSYAHRNGLIHGAVNPSNVLVTDDGQVKIAGFSPAKKQNGQDQRLSTMPLGTLYYLSPEHVRSTSSVDHRSDLYAVGMALYETLTGQTPFQAEDTAYLIMRAIVEDDFAPPMQFAPGLSEALSALVMKALAKAPEERYQSADEMLTALEALAPEASLPERPAAPPPPSASSKASSKPVSKSTRSWVLYGVFGIALAVTGVLGWWALRDIVMTATPVIVPPSEAVTSVTIQPGIYERVLSSAGVGGGGQGVLLLKAMPYGSISVSGSLLGEDSLEATVRPGLRRVFFNHPVYGLRQRIVEVGPGQRKEVICYFEGFLRVQASDENGLPLQAELFVDEQGTGRQTPVEAPYSLPPGVYTVEVFREGYLGGFATVDVRSVADDSLLTIPPIEPLEFVLHRIEQR